MNLKILEPAQTKHNNHYLASLGVHVKYYHIADYFLGWKLSQTSKKWSFRGENFHEMLNLIIGGYDMPIPAWRKLLQVAPILWMLFLPQKL